MPSLPSFLEDLFSGSADIETLKIKRNVRGLIRALKSDDQNVRDAAIEALGDIGDARAIEPLAAIFRDEPFLVAQALKNIGAPAFDTLLSGLQREATDIRWAAAKELGELGDARAIEPLLATLHDPDDGVREATTQALSRFPDARIVDALGPLLRDPDLTVRRIAIETLGKTGGASAITLLSPVLLDADRSIRQVAAEALEHLNWTPTPDEVGAAYWAAKHWWSKCAELGPHALQPLTVALPDQPYSVAEAMEKLGALAVPPLVEALRSGKLDVRRAAAKSLGTLKEARSLDALCTALQDSDAMVRQLAVTALGQIGSEQALEPLLGALRDEALRETAVKALRQLKGEHVLPALLACLQDPDRKVARAALGLLGQLQDKRAAKPIIDLLQAPEAEMRQAAIETLGRLGDPLAVEPLMETFRRSDTPCRIAAARVLGQLKDSRAVAVLVEALPETDRNLQLAVGEALGKFGLQCVNALVAALKTPALRYNAADALVKVGASAVPALLPLIHDRDVEVRHIVIETLGNIGDDHATGALTSALKDDAVRYSAAEALWKIGVSPDLKSLVTVFRDRENSEMLAALKSLCDSYARKDGSAIGLEPRVRQIGVELHRRGGVQAMRRLFEQIEKHDGAARLAKLWAGIGDWQA